MDFKEIKAKVIELLKEHRSSEHSIWQLEMLAEGKGIDDPAARIGQYTQDFDPVEVKLSAKEKRLVHVALKYLTQFGYTHTEKAEALFNSVIGSTPEEEESLDTLREIFAGTSRFEEGVKLTEVESTVERRMQSQNTAKRKAEHLRFRRELIDRSFTVLHSYRSDYAKLLRMRFLQDRPVKEVSAALNISERHYNTKRDEAIREFAVLIGLPVDLSQP